MAKQVLVIEDEPNIVEAIRFILHRDGWRVDTHADGATAVEAVRAQRPDLGGSYTEDVVFSMPRDLLRAIPKRGEIKSVVG